MSKQMRSFLLLLGSVLLAACQNEPEHIALGTLERDSLTLNALVTQSITQLPVKEGDNVVAGQMLAQFKNSTAQAQLQVAQAQLKNAQAALEEVKNGNRSEQIESAFAAWQGAQARFNEAQRQYQRTQALFKANVIGKAALDNLSALRDQSKALAEQAQQRWLELEHGARKEVLAQREAQVEAAQATLYLAQETLSNYRIVAPKDAIIDSSPWHEGDSITAGTQMFRLISQSAPYARVYLPQEARNGLHNGDIVEVIVDGYSTPFNGTVRHIRSQPAFTPYYALNEQERARLMYLTDIELPDAKQVPTGMAIEVHLP